MAASESENVPSVLLDHTFVHEIENNSFGKISMTASEPENVPSVLLDHTFVHEIENYSFGNLPAEVCREIYKDGRPFSHFIEHFIDYNYPLDHVSGCKKYDFTDRNAPTILYDEKTFTKQGCNFPPSNMLGQGRVFVQEEFELHCKKLIFCIVSNIDFPTIKIRFVRGEELMLKYPKGKIHLKDHEKFFD
jgi:hypothetical protein